MHKTYEAIYENRGHQWVDERPEGSRRRVLVTVLEERPNSEEHARRSAEEVKQVLHEARGAWATRKTPDEINREVEAVRAEWNRPWYGGEGR